MSKKTKKKTKKHLIVGKKTIPFSQSLSHSEAYFSNKVKKTNVRIIGIGGGGGTIVSEIADNASIKKASFVTANTDLQALKATSRKAIHFQFGHLLTQGLGTGMNVELAAEAAQSEKEKIKKLLANQDLCILVVSLGGGAGSGAASVFAKISKNLGNLTYGIFTLPFQFEGEKKMEIARAALEKLKKEVNILSVIPNERIFQVVDKKTPLKQALSAINKNLANSLEGLIEAIYEPGLINIDFADLRTILHGSGKLAYLNTVEVQKKDGSTQEIIEKALNNPLYSYGIRGARGVLFNIAGEKELQLSEVNQILKTVSKLINREAKIIFGISQNKKYNELIKISLLAVGCGQKIFSSQPKIKLIKDQKNKVSFQRIEPLRSKGEGDEAKVLSRTLRFTREDDETKVSSRTLRFARENEEENKVVKPLSVEDQSQVAKKQNQELWQKIKNKKGIIKQLRENESKKVKIKILKKAPELKKEESKKEIKTLQLPVKKNKITTIESVKIDLQARSVEAKIPFSLKPFNSRSGEKNAEHSLSKVNFKNNRVRKNALQIKQETEEAEKEMLEKEKFWETPAFLRKKYYD